MFKLLLVFICAVSLTASFQFGGAPPSMARRCQRTASIPLASESSTNENNVPLQQEYLTPTQVKALRKEASKRKARKQLATHVLSDDDQGMPLSESSMSAIVQLLLDNNELVEVRGISRDAKRHVRRDSERLALELEMELLSRPVFLLDTKGHAAIYYSPAGDVQLRTKYQEGQWTKKPRPKRDSRGQIIKGEYE